MIYFKLYLLTRLDAIHSTAVTLCGVSLIICCILACLYVWDEMDAYQGEILFALKWVVLVLAVTCALSIVVPDSRAVATIVAGEDSIYAK